MSDLFDAFAWRERPSRERACWLACDSVCFFGRFGMDAPSESWRPGPSDDAASLSDVAPRDLTLALDRQGQTLLYVGDKAQAEFIWPQPLSCMKGEAFLYYLPAFLAFYMDDPDERTFWIDSIRWRFRDFPFRYGSVGGWGEEILQWSWDNNPRRFTDGRFHLEGAQKWFLTGERWRYTAEMTSSMTPRERHAVAAFFDFVAKEHDVDSEVIEYRSASALLRGQAVNTVLGARAEQDNASLLKALDALRVRFPAAVDEIADVERAIGEGTTIDALLAPHVKGNGKVP